MSGLTGVQAKLSRAAAHELEFRRVFREWLAREPYGFEFKLDADSDWWRFRWVEVVPPPVDMPLIYGDVLSNLRGTLDYLAWQLVLANGEKPTGRTAFPVVRKAVDWPGVAGDRLKGVDARWVREIEAVQPYHRRDNPALHPLAVLDDLNNRSKHRALPLNVVSLHEFAPEFRGDMGGRVTQTVLPIRQTVEHGAEFFAIRFTPRLEQLDVEVPPPAFGIRFDSGLPELEEWPDLVRWVQRTLARFESALS